MQISIVVPTRDRPLALARCLGALRGQHELVVVDDGSRDRAALAWALEAAPDAALVRAGGHGPATARNLGARAASGDVVCFVDDDCEAAPGWADALARRAARDGAAAGRTVPPPGASAAVRASQTIVEGITAASLDRASGRLGFAPSCNLALAREALERLPFDGSFPDAAGEDRDWSARANGAGLGPTYVPEAVVAHRQQLGARGFVRQQYRYGRGAVRYRAAGEGRGLAPPAFYAGLVRRGFKDGAAVGALVVVAQAATALGVATERLGRASSGCAAAVPPEARRGRRP
jgi:glycosyltransferase involved in cell wall biosynthesis